MVKCKECELVDRDEIRTRNGHWVNIQLCINARGLGVEEVVDPNVERECPFFRKLKA